MSVVSPPPTPPTTGSAGALGAPGAPAPERVADSCPLCGAPLDPEQEWCLRCGAAARTRLAASSNWQAPIIALAAVATLSLGVLAAALVKLAGGSSSTTSVTTTVTRPAAVTSPGTATVTPAPSTTTAGATGVASGRLSEEPVVTPPSGAAPTKLVIKDLITGTGLEAKPGETVTVNYVGVLFHGGQETDSSWKRGKRFTFTLGSNQVIPGFEQGVLGMRVRGRRELIMPAALAYGAKGFATTVPIPPNAPLVFVVDLRKVGGSANFPFYGEVSSPHPSPATSPPVRAQ